MQIPTSPINRIIILAKHIQMGSTANGDLGNIRHQIVWYALWILANQPGRMRTDWIEVAQRNRT